MSIPLVPCRSALSPCGIPGFDFSLNPYVGCGHACVYCYASFMRRFTGHAEAWGTFVEAKSGVMERLGREVRRRSGSVLLSTVTDAYQPAEASLGLTRACLGVLADSGLSVSVLTKSDLVTRDLDVLRSFGGLLGEHRVHVGFTIATLSDDLAAVLEPGASPPSRRLRALEAVAAAGIETFVFVAPVLPGLTDDPETMADMEREARRHGAASVDFDPMNFYPAAVSGLRETLRKVRPDLLPALARALTDREGWRARIRANVLTRSHDSSHYRGR
jgi:DNA repair photolyase